MKSPFPGMDPYLEHPGVWPDFHHSFLTEISCRLVHLAPADYDVRLRHEMPRSELDGVEEKHLWLEVRRWPGDEVVTVVELLSPGNKVGEGFVEFARKRRAALRRGVHWVELDLLAGGQRTPLGKPRPAGDYFALVARADHRPDAEVYSWNLRQPLPTIPIPLRAPDADLPLALAEAFAELYVRAQFVRPLRRLHGAPPGPFAEADSAWAEARHAERG